MTPQYIPWAYGTHQQNRRQLHNPYNPSTRDSSNAATSMLASNETLGAKRLAFKRQILSKHFGRIASNQDIKRLKNNFAPGCQAFDSVGRTTKTVHFRPEKNMAYGPLYTKEETLRSWMSEDDETVSRQSIVASVYAARKSDRTESPDFSVRGLEHCIDTAARDRKVSQGKIFRQSILRCVRTYGEAAAASMSIQLSAADVKTAHEAAVSDVTVAMKIHFDGQEGSLVTRPRAGGAAKTSVSRIVGTLAGFDSFGGYPLFSLRKQAPQQSFHGGLM